MSQTLTKPKNPAFEKTHRRGPDGRFVADTKRQPSRAVRADSSEATLSPFRSRREAVLVHHRRAIAEIASRRRLRSIALVGSVARGEDTEDSDCDFLVRLPDDAGLIAIGGLRGELRDLLGCRVDVMPDDKSFRASKYASTMLRDAILL